MKNINHDLMHQLSEALDSQWRFDLYLKESGECTRCAALWQDLKNRYAEIEKILVGEIKQHVAENKFD